MNDKQTILAASHPLDRLSENESSAAVGLVKADSRFGPKMRFGSVNLCAPEKSEVINFTEGAPIDRAVDIVLLDVSDGSTHEVTVSITGRHHRAGGPGDCRAFWTEYRSAAHRLLPRAGVARSHLAGTGE